MRAEPTSRGFGITKAPAVVKCAEASCLFVLGDTHRSYLAIRSPPCYPLNYADVLSPIRSSGWRSWPPIPVVLRGHRKEPINFSFADHPSQHRGRARTVLVGPS